MTAKVEISKRLMLINSASSIGAEVLNISVLVWLQQFLLKRISDEEYALYPVLMALLILVPLLSTLMMGGLGRYVVEAYARADERRVTEIVSTLFPPLVGAGLILLAGGGWFAWHIEWFLTIAPAQVADARLMFLLLIASAAVQLMFAPFGIGLFVRQRFVVINALLLLTQMLRMSLLFALLFGVSTRILWVVVATVSANLTVTVIRIILSRRQVPALRFERRAIRWSGAWGMASFGAWTFLSHLAYLLRNSADPIILNKLAAANDVACFHLGHLAFDKAQSTCINATNPIQPALTALHATGDAGRLGNAYLRGSRYGLWAGCLAAIPIMVFHQELVLLYVGSDYLTAGTVLFLLFAQYPVAYTSLLLPRIAEATGRIRALSICSVLTHLGNIALSLYLVGAWQLGAAGVAAARFLTSVVSQPLYIPLGLHLAGVSFGRWLRETVARGLLPSVAGAAVWLPLKTVIQPAGWLTLGLCFAGGAAAYLLVLLMFCLDAQERADLSRVLVRLHIAPPRACEPGS